MRKVKFPLVLNGNLIVYPDTIEKFNNTGVVGEEVVGMYSGSLPLDDYVDPPALGPAQMSGLAFMDLVGDANMVKLLTLAKTDPICELMVKKIDRADVIDFDDAVRGPKNGLDYFLSLGELTQSEYDRIMRREFIT